MGRNLAELVGKHHYLFSEEVPQQQIHSLSPFSRVLCQYDVAYERLAKFGTFANGEFQPSKYTQYSSRVFQGLLIHEVAESKLNPQSQGGRIREALATSVAAISAIAMYVPLFILQNYAHPLGNIIYGTWALASVRGFRYRRAQSFFQQQQQNIVEIIKESEEKR